MTIQQSPSELSLLGNMLHLVVSSEADVTMTLSLGDEQLVAHTYSPDDAGQIDVDLHDIVAAYLTLTLRDEQVPYEQTGIIRQFGVTLTCGDQTEQFDFTVIRAGVDQLADTPDDFLAQNFLTWQPTVKPVTYYTPEFLTYYAAQFCVVMCKAYEGSGCHEFSLGSLQPGHCYTIPTGYAVIAGNLDILPSFYDVWIEDQEGNRLTYIQRYYASDIKSEEEEWILFENSLGGIDTFRAYGDSENIATHEHHIAEIEDVSVEYRVDTERKHKKSTGLLDEYERRWLLDFFPSKGKYIYVGQSIRRIVLIDSDVSYNAKELPSEYNFTYKFAEDKPYLNLPRTNVSLQEMHIEVPDVGSFTIAPRLVEFPRQALSGGALFPIQNPYSESWGVTTLAAIAMYLASDPGFADNIGLSENDVLEIVKGFVNGKFLSRINPDTAQGLITFLSGLVSKNVTFNEFLKSVGARRGFTDGKGIWMDALEGLIETDGLEVRGFMRVMELIINRLQLMESDYSFTEGAEVEHIGYEDAGQTLVLTIKKDHPNDYIPFYPGDILYGKVNDLLPRGGAVPDGHTVTHDGSYYTTWMYVKSIDHADNMMRVGLYTGMKPNGSPMVPGGRNFSPRGTAITTDVAAPMLEEYNSRPDPTDPTLPILGQTGYDTMLTITRHGNRADGIDPATGLHSDSIQQSQEGRQQSWVLSTTDKRLSFFWHVDEPIIRDDNYALCLGILPNLANLPSTRNRDMPSLYINTLFYENEHHIYYPSRIIKEDRGEWTSSPTFRYTGPNGTYTPDGTLSADLQQLLGGAITVVTGQSISEPYHFQSLTRNRWLTSRLGSVFHQLTDAELYEKIISEWHLDLETSRVWHDGKLWECLTAGTTGTPSTSSTDWMFISGIGGRWDMQFCDARGYPYTNIIPATPGYVNLTVVPKVTWGQEDMTSRVTSWEWHKYFADGSEDLGWGHNHTQQQVTLTDADMPPAWGRNNPVVFECVATLQGVEVEVKKTVGFGL